MVEWVYVNTSKITRIAYNSDIEIMYVDFSGSTVDVPFKGVSEKVFREFSQAKNIDDFYENHIKNIFKRIEINTENKIACNIII